MVETSDDRNGVVVNRARSEGVHAIDSTRGMADRLVEERCEVEAKKQFRD